MAKKLSILLATPMYPPTIGGPATYISLIEKELKKQGHNVTVVSFDEFLHLPKGVRHVVYFWRVWMQAFCHDIVYAHDPISVGLPALLASWGSLSTFALAVHGDYVWEQASQRWGVTDSIDDFQNKKYGFRIEFFRFIQKMVVRFARRVITPSEYLRDIVRQWVKCPNKVVATYFATDFTDITPAPLYWSSEKKIIFSAGRLVPWKGFLGLLDVLNSLPKEWHLVVVGDGPERRKLEHKTHELDLDRRVTYAGSVSHNDLIDHMLRADVFVLNSSFESFSFQTVEAMKAGLPIIVTRIGSFPEIVRNGIDGILVTPDDTTAIRNALKRYEDVDFRKSIVDSARKRADHFSVSKATDRLINVLEQI